MLSKPPVPQAQLYTGDGGVSRLILSFPYFPPAILLTYTATVHSFIFLQWRSLLATNFEVPLRSSYNLFSSGLLIMFLAKKKEKNAFLGHNYCRATIVHRAFALKVWVRSLVPAPISHHASAYI